MSAAGSSVAPGGLQERADQLALVQEAMGIITWIWDLEPEETRWFGDLSGLLGLPPGQFEGNFAHFLRCVHPDDVPAARERLRRCMKGQIQSYHSDQRVLWPDGSVHWLETYGRRTAGPDGRTRRIVGVIQDITERREAQSETQAHERRLRQLIEEAPVAIGMSRGPLVSYVNPAFMRMYGASRAEQLVGHPVLDLMTPQQQPIQLEREARHRAGGPLERHYEIMARRVDGTAFECMVSISQLSLAEDGDTLVFLEDVSERRAAERAMQALNASLEQRVAERTHELAQARDAAEAASRAKAEFLANMSHEIRTPMNAVLGFTDLALRGDIGPGVRAQLGNIHRAAHSLLGIINDILDFSKIESGKLTLEQQPFALDDVLARVATMLAPEAQRKGLRFVVDLDPAAPPRLVGDALRLQQVLLNLCGNAVKFTAAGQVSVQARVRPDGARLALALAVSDTGIGIAEEHLQRLFTPFDQLDTSTTRRYGGTGLGLVICRQLVELMGGTITVHSRPREGSRFEVVLTLDGAGPAVPPAGAGAAAGGHVVVAPAPAALAGCRILLVEDNELNQIVAVELLADVAKAQVHVASNGLQALEQLQQASFDAVLMDVQMPGIDGFETTARIRAEPRLAGLPVIAMTAHATARDRQRCVAAGMNDFVGKPFDAGDLFAVLLRWIAPRSAAPETGASAAGLRSTGSAVSLQAGLARCLGREDLFRRVLTRFMATQAQDRARFEQALTEGDVGALAQLAHGMVSTAGMLGAERLSSLARELHGVLEDGPRERWLVQAQHYLLAQAEAVAELAAYLAAGEALSLPAA